MQQLTLRGLRRKWRDGGMKGGLRRAAKLSAERRQEIARLGGFSRYRKRQEVVNEEIIYLLDQISVLGRKASELIERFERQRKS